MGDRKSRPTLYRDDSRPDPKELIQEAAREALAHLERSDEERRELLERAAPAPDPTDPFVEVKDFRKRTYLRALAMTGNKTHAAELSDIPRTTAYSWREADPQFDRLYAVAEELGADLLEAEAVRRAREGVVKAVGWYKGEPGGYEIEYSDRLLEFLLKGAKPDKYGDKLRIGALDLDKLPDWAIDRLANGEHPASVIADLSSGERRSLPAGREVGGE